MSDIIPYITTLFLKQNSQLAMPSGHLRKEEMKGSLIEQVRDVMRAWEIEDIASLTKVSDQIFDILLENRIFHMQEFDFAGMYCTYIPKRYPAFREKYMAENLISQASSLVGDRFFPDAFDGYRQQNGHETPQIDIPASDRIVELGDNHPLVENIKDLSIKIDESNSIHEELGADADQIVAEVKAAVTLTKSDRVSLAALIALLSKALKFIAEKFSGSAIGEIAKETIKQLMNLL